MNATVIYALKVFLRAIIAPLVRHQDAVQTTHKRPKSVVMLVLRLGKACTYVAFLVHAVNGSPIAGTLMPVKSASTYAPVANLSELAKRMPQSALPVPSGQLKYVVLGLGTQNYTCLGGNESDVPGTIGAVGEQM